MLTRRIVIPTVEFGRSVRKSPFTSPSKNILFPTAIIRITHVFALGNRILLLIFLYEYNQEVQLRETLQSRKKINAMDNSHYFATITNILCICRDSGKLLSTPALFIYIKCTNLGIIQNPALILKSQLAYPRIKRPNILKSTQFHLHLHSTL